MTLGNRIAVSPHPTLAELRARLAERQAYAALSRRAEPLDTTEWTSGYWTGAHDGYAIAIEALDALAAADPIHWCECGHMPAAHPYQSGPGMTWSDPCLADGCECGTYRQAPR